MQEISCVSLLIFCLVYLSVGISEVLKSSSIIVFLSISPFMAIVVVQLLSRVQLFVNPCNVACQAGFPVLHHLPEFAQTHVHWVSDAIQPFRPLSPPSLALNLSQHQGLFQWVSSSHQVAKVLELQLQHQSIQWIFRVSFRIDWFNLLVAQWTLKSSPAPQFKALILQSLAFFMVQLSHPYMTTGKNITLTIKNVFGKVMSLLFNTLSSLS